MMKIIQSTASTLILLLTTAALLAPNASAASTQPAPAAPSDELLISQTRALRQGDSGEDVAALQRQLTTLGYFSGAITGFFGGFTEDAVKLFQRDAGLLDDGIVGGVTFEAIEERLTPATPPPASTMLKLDDTGDQVSELQRRLAELGFFNAQVTGRFGPITQTAVINFQRANGLTADGIVGPGTADALRRAAAPAPVPVTPPASTGLLRRGDQGSRVADVQSRLRQLGFYSGSVNGNFGQLTEDAVKAFQRSRGLPEDGIVGPEVISALERLTASSEAPAPGNTSEPTARANPIDEILGNQPQGAQRYSVSELQRRLQEQGHNPGEQNGILTPATRQAIIEAQQEHGLSITDLPGSGN